MTETEEKSKGFKVEDRRRFSSQGDPLPEHEGDTESESFAQGASRSADPASAEKAPQPPPDRSDTTTGVGELSFSTFVIGLSSEALALMGEMPDPATGERRSDLKAAQQIIDIIGILRDKTRGNLDPQEEHLMDAVLYDLRMKYVELARSPAA